MLTKEQAQYDVETLPVEIASLKGMYKDPWRTVDSMAVIESQYHKLRPRFVPSAPMIWNDSDVSCHFQGHLKAVDGLRMPRWWHRARGESRETIDGRRTARGVLQCLPRP